ncbi:RteC domain-containing protein [Mucilaginibacter sp. X4EP1]|uniref:RteC domain-containing protein n=1 Tax=Mucilaginibacter sp. X4EP1 TaxID=2723092 RepID=UPI00216A7C5B|nr:RteC domain-containing protein [Mucilaginibacter sp. X4EP1]MCS3815483.1 hypothetical protein [Mucilaginibacter sp. X4EP1]
MLRKFSEKLLAQLVNEIAKIKADETDAFKILSAVLKAVRTALKTLKDELRKHPFKDEAEQIYFFKHLKPLFECRRIYELELYNIVTSIPAGDAEIIRNFYKDELQAVKRFFRQIPFHYGYYRLKATDLDGLLFVLGVSSESALVPETPEPDPEFATSGSYLFAKIGAFEMLRDYLVDKLKEPNGQWSTQPTLVKTKVKWTGEQVNLVELAYGLYYTGQLDSGNVEVKDIVALLEEVFSIKLKSAYHTFGNIRRRKMLSPTKFLDRMRNAIRQRVDEDLEYKPNRGIKLKKQPKDAENRD